MADEAELDATIARLEAALAMAEKTLEAVQSPPDLSGELAEAQAALSAAEEKIADLETTLETRATALAEAEARAEAAEATLAEVQATPAPATQDAAEREGLRASLADLTTAVDALRDGTADGADDSLRAEVAALRAARELDLAEMQALLAELDPMLEQAHA